MNDLGYPEGGFLSGWQERASVEERRAGAILAQLVDARGPVAAFDLIGGVSDYAADPATARAELQEDIDLLRTYGLVVEVGGEDDDAFVIAESCWQLRPLTLDAIDSVLLDRALALAGAKEAGLARAAGVARGQVELSPGDTTVSLSPRGSAARGRAEAYSRLHRLAGLMERGVTVGFGYADTCGQIAPHRLHVAGLGESRGVWYAVGTELGSKTVRAFAVSEMRGPMRELDAGGAYEVPPDFDLAERLALGWRLGPDPFPVRVRFDATLVTYIASVLAHTPLEEVEEGTLDAVLTVGDLDAFVGWVLSFGTHARIVEPAAAALRAKEILRSVVARHA
jgi:predicted DNA-binding transcriptional regulator YafY